MLPTGSILPSYEPSGLTGLDDSGYESCLSHCFQAHSEAETLVGAPEAVSGTSFS